MLVGGVVNGSKKRVKTEAKADGGVVVSLDFTYLLSLCYFTLLCVRTEPIGDDEDGGDDDDDDDAAAEAVGPLTLGSTVLSRRLTREEAIRVVAGSFFDDSKVRLMCCVCFTVSSCSPQHSYAQPLPADVRALMAVTPLVTAQTVIPPPPPCPPPVIPQSIESLMQMVRHTLMRCLSIYQSHCLVVCSRGMLSRSSSACMVPVGQQPHPNQANTMSYRLFFHNVPIPGLSYLSIVQ